jgi:hypothetical protein
MNTDKITLTLTPEEAKWLRDSLSVASSAFAEAKAEAMRKWTMQFAKGLDAKMPRWAAVTVP